MPILFAAFSALAACILLATGMTLLWPGSPLEVIWAFTEDKHHSLMAYRLVVGPAFLVLSVAAIVVSEGFLRRQNWARLVAVAALIANGLGDGVQIIMGNVFEGAIGLIIAALLVYYLTRPNVRALFH